MGDGPASSRGRIGARSHLWAVLALSACVLGYLWPVLVGGEILSPSAALYSVTPWKGLAPPDVRHYLNPLLVDLPLVDHPWRVLARTFIRHATFPAWNPYAMSGIPFWPNSQTGLFSPFNLPLWVLPLTYALGVSAALKLLAGAVGTYLLVRQLRLGALAGVLAGIAFAFSAFNIVWLAHETLPGVVVMLPWAVWLIERIFDRGRIGSAIALAIAIAVGLSGGHPGMQVDVLVIAGGYALLRAACSPRRPIHEGGAAPARLPALALVGGGLVAGVLLMAFMLLPELRASHGTVGVLARRAGQLPSARMPFRAILTTAFPDWWGRPSALEAPLTAANQTILDVNYCERTFYAGAVALLLALVGIVSPGGWRRKAPFALVALTGLAVAVHVPGLIWLARHLPVLKLVEPERLHVAYEFGVPVLAAFGLQAILDAPAAAKRGLVVASLAAAGGLLAALGAGASGAEIHRTVEHFLAGRGYAAAGVLALTAAVWFLLFAAAVGALLLLARARPRWRTGVAVGLVLLAVVDAYHFVHGFQPMGPASRVIPPVTPAIAYLERHRDAGRVIGINNVLPPDTGLVYGLRDVRGYDPPDPTTRMLNLWRRANAQQTISLPLTITTLGVAQRNMIGALGVRYVVAEPGTQPQGGDLAVAYAGPDATVLENKAVTPRAFVPARVRLTASEAATDATITRAGFDVRTEVAVERDQPGVASLQPFHGTATIAGERNAQVALRARLDARGLVVLNDDFTDGWSVRVDGRPAAPIHVNGVMRGVIVPPGTHQIVWSYAVPGLRAGALTTLATAALLALAGIAPRGRARRRRAGRGTRAGRRRPEGRPTAVA